MFMTRAAVASAGLCLAVVACGPSSGSTNTAAAPATVGTATAPGATRPPAVSTSAPAGAAAVNATATTAVTAGSGAATGTPGASPASSSSSSSSSGGSYTDATPAGAQPSGDPVIVALNTEITGDGALTGDLAKKAADIAVETINRTGGVGGHPLELMVDDAQSSNQGALASLNKASGEDHAIAMVGPVKSTQILAIEPRIRELEFPSLLGGTNPTYTQKGDPWLFRLRPTDALAGPSAAEFAINDLHLTKIGILHDSDAFGTTGADLVQQSIEKNGQKVARRESYKTGDKDFTAQLLSLKSAGVDGLIMWSTNVSDDAVIVRQIREQGLSVKLVGSPSYSQTVLVDLDSDAVDGINVVEDYFPGRTPENKAYFAAWQAKYNSTADALSGWNWDALMLIQNQWPKASGDKAKFRDNLRAVSGWRGAVGTISFDSNGDGLHSVDIMQYKGTTQEYIRTVTPQV